jgi:hypothetical protein
VATDMTSCSANEATGTILPSDNPRPDGGQFWLARVIGFLETDLILMIVNDTRFRTRMVMAINCR